jgi:hypothetical protein
MPSNNARNLIARIKGRDLTARKMIEASRMKSSSGRAASVVEACRDNNRNALALVEKIRGRSARALKLVKERRAGNSSLGDQVLTELAKEAVGRGLRDTALGRDRSLADGKTPDKFVGPTQLKL